LDDVLSSTSDTQLSAHDDKQPSSIQILARLSGRQQKPLHLASVAVGLSVRTTIQISEFAKKVAFLLQRLKILLGVEFKFHASIFWYCGIDLEVKQV
jgi:predicted transcriptional regulator